MKTLTFCKQRATANCLSKWIWLSKKSCLGLCPRLSKSVGNLLTNMQASPRCVKQISSVSFETIHSIPKCASLTWSISKKWKANFSWGPRSAVSQSRTWLMKLLKSLRARWTRSRARLSYALRISKKSVTFGWAAIKCASPKSFWVFWWHLRLRLSLKAASKFVSIRSLAIKRANGATTSCRKYTHVVGREDLKWANQRKLWTRENICFLRQVKNYSLKLSTSRMQRWRVRQQGIHRWKLALWYAKICMAI